MEPWVTELRAGRGDAMWDGFIDVHRRLIFSAIRHYLRDPDDVMDVFARVCAALRENDFARLRRYADASDPAARFSTWLVAVVRNLTVDWLRHRDGRPRHRIPPNLSPVQQHIYQHVFLESRSHRECYHLLTTADGFALTDHAFATELAATYRLAPSAPRSRESARRIPALLRGDEPAPDPGDVEPDAVRRLAELLDSLSADDRLAVQLFVVDELSAAEVARILGWPSPKTVYNRVSRALAGMRSQLRAAGLSYGDL
jgi:RNA polymerase sigma factor (sigma-70 family)